MTESENHKKIKEKIYSKFQKWYGCSIPEYYDEAHILDNYAVTSDGISIYCEVIWSPTSSNFMRDLWIIQRSDADLIFSIVNSVILETPKLVREYNKTQASKRKLGIKMSQMINGERILKDSKFVDFEFKPQVDTYLMEKRGEASARESIERKRLRLKEQLEDFYSPLVGIMTEKNEYEFESVLAMAFVKENYELHASEILRGLIREYYNQKRPRLDIVSVKSPVIPENTLQTIKKQIILDNETLKREYDEIFNG